MSSLLSKIKTLLTAQARGPRRYRSQPSPQTEEEAPPSARVEVTEAPHGRQERPEVTEGAIRPALASQSPPSPPASSRITQSARDEAAQDALEDSRVADLLQDQNED
jgi:hypothetical protein